MKSNKNRPVFKRHGVALIFVGMTTMIFWCMPLTMGETENVRAVELTIDAVDSGTLGLTSGYALSLYTIAGGGVMFATDAGGVFELSGTIGQPDAGGPTTSGPFGWTGGFWFSQPTGDCVFDGVVDLLDFSQFAQCEAGPDVTTTDSCQCQDTDSDGDVDLRDFSGLQVGFSGH